MTNSLQGKTVFISGAARGIGSALARAFALHGAALVLHARKPSPAFDELCQQVAESSRQAVRQIFFDLSDAEAMKQEMKNLQKECALDVLVNNAATQHGNFFALTPMKMARQLFEINLFSQMALTQLVLKPMLARKNGVIINMGSISGIDLKAGMSIYGSAKAAFMAWTKALAAETGAFGVRVNAIAPGLTDTDGGSLMEEKAREAMLAACAMHRLGRPEEIASLACFLASDEASFINGSIIRIDGGSC